MKTWYKSKTLWLNIIAILVFIGEWMLNAGMEFMGVTALAVGVLNLVARMITTQPITFKWK